MKDMFSFEPRLTEFLQSTTPESARDDAFSASVRDLLERCWKEWPAAEYGELPSTKIKELKLETRDKNDAKEEQETGPDLKALWTTPYKLWEHAIHTHLLTHLATESAAVQQNEQAFFDYLEKIFEFSLHFADIAGGFHLELPTRMIRETLNTLTTEHCFKVFTWIEGKAQRLVPKNKDPDRSNSMRNLALLRGLNDLLKRVSKSTKSGLSARVQFFISGLFPLSERSAVNLRGFYGDPWSGPPSYVEGKAALLAVDSEASPKKEEDDKMAVDVAPRTAAERRQFLFNAFWWLQYPFSRPFIFAEPGSLKAFMRAVDIVLPVLQEANKKDRQMAGANKENTTNATKSKSTAITRAKRKRDECEDEEMIPVDKKPRLDGLSQAARDKLDSLYRRVADLEFNAAQGQAAKVGNPASKSASSQTTFIKYLTSPDLLDLELSDPNFRRQFLFQLLITLHHLKTYTKDQKAAWCAGANKSLQIGGGSFTLNEGEEEGWVLEKERKCIMEMRFTGIATSTSRATKGEGVGIDGRAFQDMAALILERENNWVDWKAKGCPAFEKLPTSSKAMRDSRFNRAELLRKLKNWEHRLGNASLTTIWEDGYYILDALRNQAELPEVDEYLRPIEQVDAQIQSIVDKYKKSVATAVAVRAKTEHAMVTDDAPTAPAEQTADPEKASTSAHRSLPLRPGATDVPADNKPAVIPTPDINSPSLVQPAAEQLPRIPAVESKELEKQTYSWLALRAARNQYLNAFSDRKIGVADVHSLIKKVKRIKEDERKREDILAGKIVVDPGAPPATGAAALSTPALDTMKASMTPEADRSLPQRQDERDTNMEDGEVNGEAESVIVEPQSGTAAVDSQNAVPRMEVD